MSHLRLENKVAIVTGGANGIGRAVCRLFAEEGARVMIADIDVEAGNDTLKEIKSSGGDACFVLTDVSDEASVVSMVKATIDIYGTVNILVNDAAAFVFGEVEDVKDSDWDKVLSVNILGAAYCVKHVLPAMREVESGSIVIVASVSSLVAQPKFLPYSTTKGALLQMTRCLAMDLASDKIRVNCVCPGAVLTDATERHRKFVGESKERFLKMAADASFLRRVSDPKEIAYGVLFLASDEASFVTGTSLVIDGGMTAQ